MKALLQLVIGFTVAVALMVFAVELWMRTLIIFAAPLGVASLGAAWVSIDNRFVYRRRENPTPGGTAPSDQPEQHP